MESELFEIAGKAKEIIKRCNCRTQIVGGVKKFDEALQPIVRLHQSIYQSFYTGKCGHCFKVFVERVK